MKIVIVGVGKIGNAIVKHVALENHEVIVIDNNPVALEKVINQYDVMGLCGNGVSLEMQKSAGVDKADVFISVTHSDEANMLACLIAKKLGVNNTIARVRDYNYTKQIDIMTEAIGITSTINPELELAREITRIINFPEAIKVESFAHGTADISEFYIPLDSMLVGTSLMQLNSKLGFPILVCAVERGNETIIPKGNFVIEGNDKIHIISSVEASKQFVSKLGLSNKKIKNIMIIGAGIATRYLAEFLVNNKYNVKVIEIDPKKAESLAEEVPQANVIIGDGADQNLLREEGIQDSDAVICLTGIDEENIIISLYANKKSVGKIITKVNKPSFADLMESIQMASVLNSQDVTANQIVSYIRSISNTSGNNIKHLYKFVNNNVEASEFVASSSALVLGKPLKDLSLKKNILIGGIIRNHQVIIPSGLTTILEGDSVIVVSMGLTLNDLDEILV